jgi:hypothetical protein
LHYDDHAIEKTEDSMSRTGTTDYGVAHKVLPKSGRFNFLGGIPADEAAALLNEDYDLHETLSVGRALDESRWG